MGYTTDFYGTARIEPPLNSLEVSYLKDFCRMRHMRRENGPLWISPNVAVDWGQSRDPDIYDYNFPPPELPGLWCHWTPNDEGTWLEWDGGEKFYYGAEWMDFVVNKLLSPEAAAFVKKHEHEDDRLLAFKCNHTVNGQFDAEGEDSGDKWKLIITDNVVSVSQGSITYSDPRPIR